MTDRVRHLMVILDQDMRTDDVQKILDTIQMVRGVDRVELGKPVDSTDHMARWALRAELERDLHVAIRDVFHPGNG